MTKKFNQEQELNNPDGAFQRFIQSMKKKIENGTEKHGDFTKWDVEDFYEGLHREIVEYYDARKNSNAVSMPFNVAQECVDIANLCFMIHYSLTHEIYELGKELADAKDQQAR